MVVRLGPTEREAAVTAVLRAGDGGLRKRNDGGSQTAGWQAAGSDARLYPVRTIQSMNQRLWRLMTMLVLGLGILAQTGCFYLTRTYLRERDEYTATTAECRIAVTDTGGDIYVRFSPEKFADIAEFRPWLRNPLAVHFDQAVAGANDQNVFIIPDHSGNSASSSPSFRAVFKSGELSRGALVDASAPLPSVPY